MDHERSCVQQPNRSTVDDVSFVVHLYQITLFDQREGHAKRVHPESVRLDWIPHGDMTSDTFIEAVLAKNPKGGSQSALEIVPFGVLIGECRRPLYIQLATKSQAPAAELRCLAVCIQPLKHVFHVHATKTQTILPGNLGI